MAAPAPPKLRMRVGFLLVCAGEATFFLFALSSASFDGDVFDDSGFEGNSMRPVRLSVLEGPGAFDDSGKEGARVVSKGTLMGD